MADSPQDNRNNAIAALVILLVIGGALYFMPPIVLAIGRYSPVLGFVFGALVVLSFFAIFWLRSKFKR